MILLLHERVIQAIYPVIDASKLASLTILLFIVVADMLVLVDALSMLGYSCSSSELIKENLYKLLITVLNAFIVVYAHVFCILDLATSCPDL